MPDEYYRHGFEWLGLDFDPEMHDGKDTETMKYVRSKYQIGYAKKWLKVLPFMHF